MLAKATRAFTAGGLALLVLVLAAAVAGSAPSRLRRSRIGHFSVSALGFETGGRRYAALAPPDATRLGLEHLSERGRPSGASSAIEPEPPGSSSAIDTAAAAYDARQRTYLVAVSYDSGFTLRAQQVKPDGTRVRAPVDVTPPAPRSSQRLVRLLYDQRDDRFLLLWTQATAAQQCPVYAEVLAPSGVPLTSPRAVTPAGFTCHDSLEFGAVANSTSGGYLVTWQRGGTYSEPLSATGAPKGRVIRRPGALEALTFDGRRNRYVGVAFLNGGPRRPTVLALEQAGVDGRFHRRGEVLKAPRNHVIAATALVYGRGRDDFLLAWTDERPSATSIRIFTDFLRADLIDGRTLRLKRRFALDAVPTEASTVVAYDPLRRRYLAAWPRTLDGNSYATVIPG